MSNTGPVINNTQQKEHHMRKDRGYIDGFTIGVIAVVVLVIGIIVGSTFLIGGTWSETNASSMTCVYNGGPLDDNNYIGYEGPASGRAYQGFASAAFNVPVSIRQYRVSLDPSQGDVPEGDSVKVRVKGYEMEFEPTVNFTISTVITNGKPAACDFIEKQLRQFGATDFDDPHGQWVNWLNERYRPILNDVASRVLQQGDPGDLKFNIDGARDRAALEIGKQLNTQLVASLGGDFFCDTSYSFGQDEAACGDAMVVVLPEPKLTNAADEDQLSKPQRAKIDADNDIAAANQAARKAQEVADAKAKEALSAKTLADANEKIAKENARVLTSQAQNDYAWCAYLTSLGQDCALVKAAQNNDYPDVVVQSGNGVDVAVPVK